MIYRMCYICDQDLEPLTCQGRSNHRKNCFRKSKGGELSAKNEDAKTM